MSKATASNLIAEENRRREAENRAILTAAEAGISPTTATYNTTQPQGLSLPSLNDINAGSTSSVPGKNVYSELLAPDTRYGEYYKNYTATNPQAQINAASDQALNTMLQNTGRRRNRLSSSFEEGKTYGQLAKMRERTVYNMSQEEIESDLAAQYSNINNMATTVAASDDKLNRYSTQLLNMEKDLNNPDYSDAERTRIESDFNALYNEFNNELKNRESLVLDYNYMVNWYHEGYSYYVGMMRGKGKEAEDLRTQAQDLNDRADQLRLSELAATTEQEREDLARQSRELDDQAYELRQQANAAENDYYYSFMLSEDFDKYKSHDGRKKADDDVYNFINDIGGTRRQQQHTYTAFAPGGGTQEIDEWGEEGIYDIYTYMTDEQVGVYNYIYSTEGKESADKFLDFITNELNQQKATDDFDRMTWWEKGLYFLPQGLNQWATGIQQLFHEEAIPTSTTQYTGQLIRQEIREIGADKDANGNVIYGEDGKPVGTNFGTWLLGAGYDLGVTTANMLPSVAVGKIVGGFLGTLNAWAASETAYALGGGKTAINAIQYAGRVSKIADVATKVMSPMGTVTMGLGAAGNAYKEALEKGWSPGQARTYAALVGLSETGLERVLGGIDSLMMKGGLSDRLLTNVLEKVGQLDNGFTKFALTAGSKFIIKNLSEGVEEGLQDMLEPLFSKVVANEDTSIDWGEVGYSFLMGLAMAGVFDGFENVAGSWAEANPVFDPGLYTTYTGESGIDWYDGVNSLKKLQERHQELLTQYGEESAQAQEIENQYAIREAFYKGKEIAQKEDGAITLDGEATQAAREADQRQASRDEYIAAAMFVNEALNNRETKTWGTMSNVKDYTAETVKDITGVDISGRKVVITGQTVRNISKAEGRTRDLAKLINDVIGGFTEVDANASGDSLVFYKDYKNATISVQAHLEYGNALQVDGMHITMKEQAPAEQAPAEQAPAQPETEAAAEPEAQTGTETAPEQAPAETIGEEIQRQLAPEEAETTDNVAQTEQEGATVNGEELGKSGTQLTDTGTAAAAEPATADTGSLEQGRVGNDYDTGRGRDQSDSGAVAALRRILGKGRANSELITQRQKKAGVKKLSTRDLGQQNGNTEITCAYINEADYDDELRAIQKVANILGVKDLRFVSGIMSVVNKVTLKAGTKLKDGTTVKEDTTVEIESSVNDITKRWAGSIVIRADLKSMSASQIFLHTMVHWLRNDQIIDSFMEAVKAEGGDWQSIYKAYEERWYNLTNGYTVTGPDGTRAMTQHEKDLYVFEEILADAYAKVNNYSVAAGKYNAEAIAAMDGVMPDALQVDAGTEAAAESTAEETQESRGPPEGEGKYSYGGFYAKGADLISLIRATGMEAKGESEEDILEETGWYKGSDGEWRFEISDEDMKLKVSPDALLTSSFYDGEFKLSQLIDHPKLFAAYPKFGDIRVQFANLGDGARGSYNKRENIIGLSQSLRSDPDQLLNTLAHELQHAIQVGEGFALGANIRKFMREGATYEEAVEKYYNAPGEREARDVARRRTFTDEERKNTLPDAFTRTPAGQVERYSYNPETIDYAINYTTTDETLRNQLGKIKGYTRELSDIENVISHTEGYGYGNAEKGLKLSLHTVNDYLRDHMDVWQRLWDIQQDLNAAGLTCNFVTPPGVPYELDNVEVQGGLIGLPIEYVPSTTGKRVKFERFWRHLSQMVLDSFPHNVRESVRGELLKAVEDGYRRGTGEKDLLPYFGEQFPTADEISKVAGPKSIKNIAAQTVDKVQAPLRSADKTIGALNLNTACPMFTIGNNGCYLDACYLTSLANGLMGTNLYRSAWYTGEILQLADSDIALMNAMGGLRVNGMGDTTMDNKSQLKDAIRHAGMRGLKVKIITKQRATLEILAEMYNSGQDISHVTVQPSMDNMWVPAELDDVYAAGVRGSTQIADTVAKGNTDAAETGYEEMFGRATKTIDGSDIYSNVLSEIENYTGKMNAKKVLKYLTEQGVSLGEIQWSGIESYLTDNKDATKEEVVQWLRDNAGRKHLYRKYGFSPEQVQQMKADYPFVQITPRYVVCTAQEIAELALNRYGEYVNGGKLIQTLMHGKVPAGCVSDYPGEILNFNASRHVVAKDKATGKWHFYGELIGEANAGEENVTHSGDTVTQARDEQGRRIGKVNKRIEGPGTPYGKVEAYVEANYTPLEQNKIWTTLKNQMCCQANDFKDACAGCQSLCANGCSLYSSEDFDFRKYTEREKANAMAGIDNTLATEAERFSSGEMDEEYQRAVDSGDEERQLELVKEAAKAAGVALDENGEPLLLYHGTGDFGFTRFYDGLIFTSPEIGVSKDYSKYTGRRNIFEAISSEPRNINDLIDSASKLFGEQYTVMPDEEKEQRKRTIESELSGIANKIKNALVHGEFIYDSDVGQPDNFTTDALHKLYSLFQKVANKEYYGRPGQFYKDYFNSGVWAVYTYLFDLKNKNDKVYTISNDGVKAKDIGLTYEMLSDIMHKLSQEYYHLLSEEALLYNGKTITSYDELRRNVREDSSGGVYGLYGILGSNPFIYDAGQSLWDELVDKELFGDDEEHTTDELANAARAKGYTSVIIRNVDDSDYGTSDDYIFFNSNQLKSADRMTFDDDGVLIPLSERFNTQDQDIRYSAEDSDGNELSEAQQVYFENSIVRDDQGRLLKVYHGSPAQFTVFDPKYMSTHGSSYGQGFYFTDNRSLAEGYEGEDGQLLGGYLNIQNPLSDTEVTLTRAEVRKLLQAVDPTGDNAIINYDSQGGLGYPSKEWYNRALGDMLNSLMEYDDSDSEILADIANSGAGVGNVLSTAREVLGYDGYIAKGEDGDPNIYVAFESNQFKNADNTDPTEDQDIRFSSTDEENPDNLFEIEPSTRFSLAEPVEKVGNLIAVHNVNERKLRETLNLGGFPMPSIAVTRAGNPNDQFGWYSVVFNKSAIDPQADPRNKVYGKDVWTPTGYDVDIQELLDNNKKREFNDTIEKLSGNTVKGQFKLSNILDTHIGYLDGEGNNVVADNITGLVEQLSQDPTVQAAFLAHIGKDIEPAYTWEDMQNRSILAGYNGEFFETLLNKIGEERIKEISEIGGGMTNEEFEILLDAEIEAEMADPVFGAPEDMARSNILSRPLRWHLSNIEEALDYYNKKRNPQISLEGTRNKLFKYVYKNYNEEIISWINNLLSGISAGKILNEDINTPATLENIVKEMRKAGERGVHMSRNATARSLGILAAKEYGSIDDIHADELRLPELYRDEEKDNFYLNIEDEEQEIDKRIDDIIREINDRYITNPGTMYRILIRAAEGDHSTDAIYTALNNAISEPVDIKYAEELSRLIDRAANMPTDYFEAKPQRSIGFDEVAAVVAPDDIPKDLLNQLQDIGIDVRTYPNHSSQERAEALNSIPNVKFSSTSSEEMDQEYLRAVESGDEERQLELVKEAAKAAGVATDESGNPIDLYHGTRMFGFTVFGENPDEIYMSGFDNGGTPGLFFTTTSEFDATAHYGGPITKISDAYKGPELSSQERLMARLEGRGPEGTYHLYGILGDNPLIIDAKGAEWNHITAPELFGDDDLSTTDEIAIEAEAQGYTSVIIKNVLEEYDTADDYIFFDSSQLKSADPVTYDDAGNVIPLSERFNTQDQDIRYSGTEDETDELSLPKLSESGPVSQAISSARTSIKQLPALFKNKNVKFGDTNIDIGGGRFDLATEYLNSIGTQNLVFDPYNRDKETNRATLQYLQDGNKADTATCANVLNVIAEPAARANVILEAAKAIKPDGTAYFMVYEGDGSGVGKETSSGYQNNRKTADYVGEIENYFDDVKRQGKLITASNPKADLPQASWEIQPGEAIRYSAGEGLEDLSLPTLEGTERELAPALYSKLQREIENFKGQKIGAASAVSYLKGRGVKAEEIKWSGIEKYLEGKKSVDKDELLQWLRDNEYKIETVGLGIPDREMVKTIESMETELKSSGERLDNLLSEVIGGPHLSEVGINQYRIADASNAYMNTLPPLDKLTPEKRQQVQQLQDLTMDHIRLQAKLNRAKKEYNDYMDENDAKWGRYRTFDGDNYRELLYTVPGSGYINRHMDEHWDRPGVLMHTRVEDITANDGEPVLFIEEIQSDWHNAGHTVGYSEDTALKQKRSPAELNREYNDLIREWQQLFPQAYAVANALSESGRMQEEMFDIYAALIEVSNDQNRNTGRATDSMRELAAEARSKMNDEEQAVWDHVADYQRRDYANYIERNKPDNRAPAAPYADTYQEYILKNLLREAAEGDYKYLAWTPAQEQANRWGGVEMEVFTNLYDRKIPKYLNKFGKQYGSQVTMITADDTGEAIPAIEITDAMRDSLLYEGQPKYSSTEDEDLPELGLPGIEERYAAAEDSTTKKWNGLPEGYTSIDEYVASAQARAEKARQERLQRVGKADFEGSPSLQKLGVKIDNSVGQYGNVDELREYDKAAKDIDRVVRRAERRLDPTPAEKEFASGLAAGVYNYEDIPDTMNADKVEELADYYTAQEASKQDMIRQVRTNINRGLEELSAELFKDSDEHKPSRVAVMNYRTPKRNMLKIFGDEAGAAINDSIFEPVAVNEAERFRFVNRMLDEVRRFQDKNGKMKKLTKAERAATQLVIEGKAAAEIVAGMEMHEAIENAAHNLMNGESLSDVTNEFGLTREQQKLAQKYARWLQTQEMLNSGKIDAVKVENAAQKYSEMFDLFYDAINDFLVAHGYEPIGFIKGYAPHLQPDSTQSLLNRAFERMGIGTDVTRLPTSIAGITADFRPNKRWNPYFLQRTGELADLDIATGYESYVEFMSDVLYHTDDIMRVRAAAKYFRKTYSKKEISELISWAQELRYGKPEEKAEFLRSQGVISNASVLSPADIDIQMDEYIDKLYNDIKNLSKYSDLVMWLDNYGNLLAGKQTLADRSSESNFGRESLNVFNKLSKAFARAQVAGSMSSMLNQMSQLPMIQGELGSRWTTAALRDMMFKPGKMGVWSEDSDFLTGKKGVTSLAPTAWDMVLTAMFKPAEISDRITSTIAVRGRYLKELAAGKSHEAAMKAADDFGEKVMGSRMKGSKPVGFYAKNPVAQLVNIFQVEAINSWEHVSQDLPRDFRTLAREKGKGKAALALAGVIVKTLLAAFMLNRLDDELYGGTPAPFDLLGLSANFIASGEKLSTNEYLRTLIDNVWEKQFGERLFDTDADKIGDEPFDYSSAFQDLGYNLSNEVPFFRNVSGLLGLGDATLPLPDIYGTGKDLYNAIKNEGIGSWDTARAAMQGLFQLIPGGKQLSKTMQATEYNVRGGDFSGSGDNEKLKYPADDDFWSVVQSELFGKYATNASDDYYASGRKALSANQTQLWRRLVEDGVDSEYAYEMIHSFRNIHNNSDLTSDERGEQERQLINGLDLTDNQKLIVYRELTGADSRTDKFSALVDAGLSFSDVMDIYDKYHEIEGNDDLTATQQATEMSKWLDQQEYDPDLKAEIKNQFKYWQILPASASRYEELTSLGLDSESAYDLTNTLSDLEPAAGKASVSDMQRYRAIANDTSLTTREKLSVIGSIMGTEMTTDADNPTQWAYLNMAMDDGNSLDGALDLLENGDLDTYSAWRNSSARSAGISAEIYIEWRHTLNSTHADRDSNGKSISGTKKVKVVNYIDSLPITPSQKDVLYYDAGYAKSGIYDTPWYGKDEGLSLPGVNYSSTSRSTSTQLPEGLRLPSLYG